MRQEKKPSLAAAHPVLARLESVSADIHAVCTEYASTLRWLSSQSAEILPTRWTERIEAATDKPEELEKLRIEYDELALSFLSVSIKERTQRTRFFDNRSAICDAIRAAIEVFDKLPKGEEWLKPFIQGAVIEASEAHRLEPQDLRYDSRLEGLGNRAERIMYAAYTKLAQELAAPTCNPAYYADDLVVPGRAVLRHLADHVDLRRVYHVDFVDCVSDEKKHPLNAELAALLTKLWSAREEAWAAVKYFKADQNGSVNESQHASRLIDMLHGEHACYAANQAAVVEEQNKRRWRYAVARHGLVLAISNLKKAREAVAAALRGALAEATPTIERTRQRSSATVCITVDEYDTARIMMNNCLAADLSLRTIGRELKELEEVSQNDLSRNQGTRALAAAYEDVARSYRPFKLTEKSEKAES